MSKLKQHFPLFAVFCITNIMVIIIPILEDKQPIHSRPNHTFRHPLIQTCSMQIGEMLCLFVFLLAGGNNTYEQRFKPPFYIIGILTLLDICASGTLLISLSYIPASTFSIMSSSLIIFTALFSKILLNKSFKKIQIIGCLFSLIGIVINGVGEKISTTYQQNNHQFIGFVFAMASFVSQGLFFVFIERIYKNYQIDSIELVGRWGTLGTIFCLFCLMIFSNTSCPFNNSECVADFSGGYHGEYLPSFFNDLRENCFLTVLIIMYIIGCSVLNYAIAKIIMVSSAMVFAILTIFNNCFIWVTGIVITIVGEGNEQFRIENLSPEVILIKLVGFILTSLGLLLYNQIICQQKNAEEDAHPLNIV